MDLSIKSRNVGLLEEEKGRTDMETSVSRISLRLIKVLNVVLMTIAMTICWCIGYAEGLEWESTKTAVILGVMVFAALYMTYGRIYECFLVSIVHVLEMIYSQCLALAMSDALMYVVFCLVLRKLVYPIPVLLVFVVQVVLSAIWCVLVQMWYFKKFPPKKTAIVYDRNRSIETLINAYGLQKKFEVKHTVMVDVCIGQKFSVLKDIEVVFLCGVHSHERNIVLKYCIEKGITVYVLPRIGDTIMSGAMRMHLFRLPFLRVGRYNPTPEYLVVKRLFDVIVSAVALVVLSPVMLITAAAIKLTDGGTVFYKQKRLTRNGKEFFVLKFRSMRQDAEKDGIARLSSGDNDDRITPIGRLIRKVRIDELPQLINILEGSMSIVGPRPERPEIAEQYEKELPEFSLRLQAKAGLTGYAQVYGKYNTSPYDKLQMDLMYIAHPSFLEDLRIIFATVKILFLPESTEGVAKDMETAMEKQEEEKKIS